MVKRTEMITRVQNLIDSLPTLKSADAMPTTLWKGNVEAVLKEAYGADDFRTKAFQDIRWIPYAMPARSTVYNMGDPIDRGPTRQERSQAQFQVAKTSALELLNDCISNLEKTYVPSEVFHGVNSTETVTLPKKIFITHGTSEDWNKVQRYIEKDVKIETLELSEENSRGKTIIEKLETNTEKCSFAIIVMTGDDTDQKGSPRVRQNVMFEIGWFYAAYGRSNVCLLLESGLEIPSNMSGIVYEYFSKGNIESTFIKLRKEIESAFAERDEAK